MAHYKLFVLPGDGIGPEVMAEAEKIAVFLTAEGIARFEIEKGRIGGAAYDAHGLAISDANMTRAQEADAVLLAAVGGTL
jgi:3-isopropylmalate dehydrogenase